MTNTLNKIMHNGDEYMLPEWFSPDNAWTTDDVLRQLMASGWWDVVVSSQPNNILTSWMKIWAGTETNYWNLGTYDSNCLYLVIE